MNSKSPRSSGLQSNYSHIYFVYSFANVDLLSTHLLIWQIEKQLEKINKGITCIHTKKMKKNCEQGNITKCFWCFLCKALPSLTHHHQSLLDPIRHHLRLLQNIKKFLNSQFSVTNHYYTDNIQVTLEGSNSRSKTVVFLMFNVNNDAHEVN